MPNTKPILLLWICLLPFYMKAQLKHVQNELKRINFQLTDTTKGWDSNGKLMLKLNQAMYKSWQGGADNNIELGVSLNEKINYKTQRMMWDNYFFIDFGVNKLKNQEIRKTQDRLEYNTLVGITLPHNWSVSYFINLQTQLTNSYNYDKDTNKENRINGFLAPLYATTGPGIIWKKNNNLYFNIAPVTYKLTYVNGRIHRYDEASKTFKNNEEIEILGIEPGKKTKYQLGFYSSAFYKFNLTNNIEVDNRLSLYSDYLDDFSNMDFDYTMRMHLGVNDFLSTLIIIQLRYDDDAYQNLQTRESLGIGLTFNI